MKIYTNNQSKLILPEIVTDVSGMIIYLNQSAKTNLKLKLGESIGSLIDINDLRKLSMFSKRIEIFETQSPEYKEAIVTILGEGINKTLKINLFKGYNKREQDLLNDKNILSVANNIELNRAKREIKLPELCEMLRSVITTSGNYINVYSHDESFYYNESYLQALILCSVAMMNETSPRKPVDLYIKKIDERLEIKVIVRVDEALEIRGAQEIKTLFPWCAIRIAFIDSICVSNNIEYSINMVERSLKIVFKVNKIKKDAFALRFDPAYTSTLQEMYSLLAPRENVAFKYDKQGEEQE